VKLYTRDLIATATPTIASAPTFGTASSAALAHEAKTHETKEGEFKAKAPDHHTKQRAPITDDTPISIACKNVTRAGSPLPTTSTAQPSSISSTGSEESTVETVSPMATGNNAAQEQPLWRFRCAGPVFITQNRESHKEKHLTLLVRRRGDHKQGLVHVIEPGQELKLSDEHENSLVWTATEFADLMSYIYSPDDAALTPDDFAKRRASMRGGTRTARFSMAFGAEGEKEMLDFMAAFESARLVMCQDGANRAFLPLSGAPEESRRAVVEPAEVFATDDTDAD